MEAGLACATGPAVWHCRPMPSDSPQRWWQRWRRPRPRPDLDPSRPDLVVVASGFDDAEAASATLARAEATPPRWDPSAQAVLRHHLVLPADRVADAVAVAGQDGYVAVEPVPLLDVSLPDVPGVSGVPLPDVPDGRVVVLQRVQVLDALHCSQERSRMAGLAQRREGFALGWDALQPDPDPG